MRMRVLLAKGPLDRMGFRKFLTHVKVFSGRTEAPEVKCDLRDRQTNKTATVALAVHVTFN